MSSVVPTVVNPFDHEYTYGAIPFVTLRSIEPVALPLHNTFTCVALKIISVPLQLLAKGWNPAVDGCASVPEINHGL